MEGDTLGPKSGIQSGIGPKPSSTLQQRLQPDDIKVIMQCSLLGFTDEQRPNYISSTNNWPIARSREHGSVIRKAKLTQNQECCKRLGHQRQ